MHRLPCDFGRVGDRDEDDLAAVERRVCDEVVEALQGGDVRPVLERERGDGV